MVLVGYGFTQDKNRGTAGPVLAIPFRGQSLFVLYAVVVAIVHRKI